MEEIRQLAFSGCSSVKKIVMPTTLTSLGAEIFSYTDALKELHYRGTETQWSKITKDAKWHHYAGILYPNKWEVA